MPIPSFSEIARYRAEDPGLRRIAVIHDLIGRYGKIAPVLQRHLASVSRGKSFRVLDIGAYDRAFGNAIARSGLSCTYQSVDVDGSSHHDFRKVEDVNGPHDAIAMFELIEHLSFEEVDKLLHTVYDLLMPEGRLFISTPNPFHPARYFADASHKQHWPAHDLYALLRHVGFGRNNIEMFGVVYTPPSPIRRGVDAIRNVMWRVIGLETRGGILAIAIKGKDRAR